jgi:hypothetical protein
VKENLSTEPIPIYLKDITNIKFELSNGISTFSYRQKITIEYSNTKVIVEAFSTRVQNLNFNFLYFLRLYLEIMKHSTKSTICPACSYFLLEDRLNTKNNNLIKQINDKIQIYNILVEDGLDDLFDEIIEELCNLISQYKIKETLIYSRLNICYFLGSVFSLNTLCVNRLDHSSVTYFNGKAIQKLRPIELLSVSFIIENNSNYVLEINHIPFQIQNANPAELKIWFSQAIYIISLYAETKLNQTNEISFIHSELNLILDILSELSKYSGEFIIDRLIYHTRCAVNLESLNCFEKLKDLALSSLKLFIKEMNIGYWDTHMKVL